MTDSQDLLLRSPHVLLDFDGPVCSIFSTLTDRQVAAELRAFMGENGYPDTSDPFDILLSAAKVGRREADNAERELARLEVVAAGSAEPTAGAVDVIRALAESGHTVTVVSNNSTQAVVAYLEDHRLVQYIVGVSARRDSLPDHLKPDPYLLHQAMNDLAAVPQDCVMIGDSVSDLVAARRAGTAAIGYANKPGKREQFEKNGADLVITSMTELVGG
ncbi:MAG TPA: HAD-IA family hydrolase [Actinokineospora sp.]|jgi:HAD superfamily hydrolase (TIGR01549 family)|nr:HAD-IA family hydrolase [Actinokineospora sp.]